MRKIVVLILLLFSLSSYAQYANDFGIHLGASNYLGEIGGKEGPRRNFVSDMKLNKTQFAFGGFARHKVLPILYGKVGLNWLRIEGADRYSKNPGRVGRNLSFRNDIIEAELQAQIFFYDIQDLGKTYKYQNDFKMYAFGGVGCFYSNPKAYYNGKWVALQPLQTEGKKYSRINASIPLGLGLCFTLSKRHRIGWEFEWRTTFTDYLDDISGVYADPADLNSDLAVALANRRGELGGDQPGVPEPKNYIPGQKRGDATHNDSYLSTSFYYSYVMRGRSNFYTAKFGSIFKRKGSKKRKIRAKF
ncbi:MAG TPA: DUF6089 family protein [Bacteroidia bacterium]|jgi:hypothetical protein|nr:DUF6089 family protein [Bacteroidia bacterium]